MSTLWLALAACLYVLGQGAAIAGTFSGGREAGRRFEALGRGCERAAAFALGGFLASSAYAM